MNSKRLIINDGTLYINIEEYIDVSNSKIDKLILSGETDKDFFKEMLVVDLNKGRMEPTFKTE